MKLAAETDNVFQNTKYNLSRMLPTKCDALVDTVSPMVTQLSPIVTVADLGATKSNLQMFALWDLQNYYAQTQERFIAKAKALNLSSEDPVDESFAVPTHAYDDAFVTQQQFYCTTCHVQLLSDKDVVLHKKGKKHKKKLRELSSATVSDLVAKSAVVQVRNQLVDRQSDDSRAPKRVKRDDEASESTKPAWNGSEG